MARKKTYVVNPGSRQHFVHLDDKTVISRDNPIELTKEQEKAVLGLEMNGKPLVIPAQEDEVTSQDNKPSDEEGTEDSQNER